MDDRLWMTDDFDPLRRQLKEMMRRDHLQAFVHHRGRMARDLGPRAPIRVGHGLLRGDCWHLLESPLAEWPAARRENDPLDRIGAIEVEALPYRIMFAVDRQQRRAEARHLLHNKAACADEHLLVGEGDNGPSPDRG